MVPYTMTVVRKKNRSNGSKRPPFGSSTCEDLNNMSAVNDRDAASEARNSACHDPQSKWKQQGLICESDQEERHLFDACFDSLPECCVGGPVPNTSFIPIQSIVTTSPKAPVSNSSCPPSLLTPPSSPLEAKLHPSNSIDAASASAGTKSATTGTLTPDEFNDNNIKIRNKSGGGQEPFPYKAFMEWVGVNLPFMGDCGEIDEVQLKYSQDSLPARDDVQQCSGQPQQCELEGQLHQPLQQQRQFSPDHQSGQKSTAAPQDAQKAITRLEKTASPFGSYKSSWLSGHSYLIQQTVAATESSIKSNNDVNTSEKSRGTVARKGYKRNRSSLVMTGTELNRLPPRYCIERTQSLERITQQPMTKELHAHKVCRSTSHDLVQGRSNFRPGTPSSLGLPPKPPSPCRTVSSLNNKLRQKNNSRPNTPIYTDCSGQDLRSTDCSNNSSKREHVDLSAPSCGPYSCDDTCGAAYQVDDACTLRNLDDSTVSSFSSVGTNPNNGLNAPSCSHDSITATLLASDNRMHRSAPNSRPASPFHGGMPVSLDKLLSRRGSGATVGGDDVDAGTTSHAECSKSKEEISVCSSTNISSGSLHKRIRSWGRKSNSNVDDLNITSVPKKEDTACEIAERVIDIAPYAVLHDELLEALIDQSLKVSGEGEEISIAATKMVENPTSTDAFGASNATRQAPNPATKEYSPSRISRTHSAIWKRNKPKQLKGSARTVANDLRQDLASDTVTQTSSRENLSAGESALVEQPKDSSPTATIPTSSKSKMKISLDLIHPQCQLMKEKGPVRKDRKNTDTLPSAVGREATLLKLKEKLSLLGDIESGKFGKAAEMLRSDAVAFAIRQHNKEVYRLSSSQLVTIKEGGSDEITVNKETSSTSIPLVETRSLLTLQMGFVSMSYGILLQWDCASRKVVLIVLRKMCRDDFLVRDEVERPILSASSSTDFKPSKEDPVISHGTSNALPQIPKSYDTSSVMSMMSLTPNPMAALVPKFLNESSLSVPPSLLSVSVLNVKQLHGGCKDCWNNANEKNDTGVSSSNRRMNRGKSKGNQSIRPYIRFVLGKHQHLTKPAKFNNGNPVWYKVHNNSCLLPCPSDGYRWFAGQEDLIVEVRDKQLTGNLGAESIKGNSVTTRLKGHDTATVTTDPVLAVVTVPLSSVNIEEGDSEKSDFRDSNVEDENDTSKTSISERLTPRRLRRRNTNSGVKSSSTVTLPIRMRTCPSAPFGSISLQITIKAPSPSSSVPIPSLGNAVSESIEIGPFTKLMKDWSLQDTATQRDSAKGENSPKLESSKATIDRKISYKRKLRNRFRWSKKYDHSKKEWASLPPNASIISSSCKKDDSSNSGSEANWFTFLFRESNKDTKE